MHTHVLPNQSGRSHGRLTPQPADDESVLLLLQTVHAVGCSGCVGQTTRILLRVCVCVGHALPANASASRANSLRGLPPAYDDQQY